MSTWERNGCICSVETISPGDICRVTVKRKDEPEVCREATFELFNPYAFFGYDYEDSMVIDGYLESFLKEIGDTISEEKIKYQHRFFWESVKNGRGRT